MNEPTGRRLLEILHWKPADLKKARWPLLGLVVGILLLTLRDAVGAPPPAARPGSVATPPSRVSASASPGVADPIQAEADRTAQALAALLHRIPGAGAVEVHVTLAGGPVQQYADQVTTSRTISPSGSPSAAGGSAGTSSAVVQETGSRQPVLETSGAGQKPLPVQTLAPQVVGVLVVAAGAGDPRVRAELSQAVTVALGVPAYRVAVLPGTGGR